MAQPGQLGEPDVVLGQERVDRIVASGALVPVAQVDPGRQDPRLAPDLTALGSAVAARSCLAATVVLP